MLRAFRLSNHRSFRDEQELLLMPSYDNEHEVVPVAAVFGANASGKSNLLDGLRLMARLVQGCRRDEPGLGISRSPFRLAPGSLLEASSFEVELILDSVRYVYGFAVDDERVTGEWLHSYPRNRKRTLFERDGTTIDFGSTVTGRARAEAIQDLVTEDALLLSKAEPLKLEQYLPVMGWFRRSLLFVRPGARKSDGERIARFLERSDSHDRFVELARAADVGISDLEVEYIEDPRAIAEAAMLAAELEQLEQLAEDPTAHSPELAERMQRARSLGTWARERSRRARLLVRHGDVGFELQDESDGTRLWLELLPEVISGLRRGQTLVIDEIDTSLHPLLVRKLVGLFRDPDTNVGGAQLLFTTHDAFLLAPIAAEPGVDRDQVWFVEKNRDGASELYPLTDFKPRNEHNLARRYLGGAYGAVPILDGFDHITAMTQGE